MTDLRATRTPLRISLDRHYDFLEVVEYGAVAGYRPEEWYVEVSPHARYVRRSRAGTVIGFQVCSIDDELDLDGDDAVLFDGPRFDAPTLGLRGASAGEITLAAIGMLTDCCTIDNGLFHQATGASGDDALPHWRSCIEAGELRGHYGAGYTLCELGRPVEAYAHLRIWTEVCPHDPWGWTWLGKACEARGDVAEARRHYRRALREERRMEVSTEAGELLKGLRRR